MSHPLAPLVLLAVLAGVGMALGQPPARKLPPPRLVEEGGKKIAVFTYGQTDPAVKVGELTFRLLPLMSTDQKIAIGYEVENRTNNTVRMMGKTPDWRKGEPKVADDTGRAFTVPGTEVSRNRESDWGLFPDHGNRSGFGFTPQANPACKAMTAEVAAPPGAEAERWRIVYPKRTWVERWPAFEEKLPTLKKR